mgnify:CR=1 FL=1
MISIIIRNKNEAQFIGFTLQSCLDFFGKPEIIVLDNNSKTGNPAARCFNIISETIFEIGFYNKSLFFKKPKNFSITQNLKEQNFS